MKPLASGLSHALNGVPRAPGVILSAHEGWSIWVQHTTSVEPNSNEQAPEFMAVVQWVASVHGTRSGGRVLDVYGLGTATSGTDGGGTDGGGEIS